MTKPTMSEEFRILRDLWCDLLAEIFDMKLAARLFLFWLGIAVAAVAMWIEGLIR